VGIQVAATPEKIGIFVFSMYELSSAAQDMQRITGYWLAG
jgi:hypothetical protein